jgi:hypothetical protein
MKKKLTKNDFIKIHEEEINRLQQKIIELKNESTIQNIQLAYGRNIISATYYYKDNSDYELYGRCYEYKFELENILVDIEVSQDRKNWFKLNSNYNCLEYYKFIRILAIPLSYDNYIDFKLIFEEN